MAQNDEITTGDIPGALEGISRIRLDCEQTSLAIVADPAMVGQLFLSEGNGGNQPSLVREGDEIVVYQRGRRSGDRAPTLTVPAEDCPPISGSLDRGELYLGGLNGSVEVHHGQGDTRIDGGNGALVYHLGKGDVRLVNRLGSAELRVGAGDIHVSGLTADLAISLGKGDVTCDTLSGSVGVQVGSGDVAVTDSTGSVAVKLGSGDVSVTRPRRQVVAVKLGNGDVIIRNGNLAGMAIQVARGDIVSTAQLILSTSGPTEDDQTLVSRILRSKGVSFTAGDKGLRFSRPGFDLEAGDAGLRITKGGFSFVAGDQGISFSTSDASDAGSFSVETSAGDIVIDLPSGAPVRVEALIAGGDIRSDIPLVSVGRPGPRGATQRYVGVTDPSATERVDLRLKAERGDIRVRMLPSAPHVVAPTPPAAPTPPVPPTPPAPPEIDRFDRADAPTTRVPLLTREQQMRAILDALARGEVSVGEADRMLAALDRTSSQGASDGE